MAVFSNLDPHGAAGAWFVDNVMAGKFALDEKGSTTGGGKTIPDIALLFELMLFGMFPLGFVIETGLPILQMNKKN